MKIRFHKTLCKVLIVLLTILFCQTGIAATSPIVLLKTAVAVGDTSQQQKPGRLKRTKKVKKDEDDDRNQEDGVDDDIRARGHQEFLQQRDPKLNRIPVERLLTARKLRDQFLNNIKTRTKNAKPQGNVVKPSQNSNTAQAKTAALTASISGLQWQERGPNNVGGRTRALMFDKADSVNGYKRVFAGGVGGGLWVTSDITATPVQWTKIDDFFDNIAISCIAQNPVNPKEIYAGTGEGFLNADAIQGLGVWKTEDGGATWTQLTSTEGFKYINAILVDRNGSVYVAGESDVFVGFGVDQSTDGGNTWTNVINSTEAGADLQLAANGDVYASTGVIYSTGHVYISDYGVNGAQTGNASKWTNITPSATGVITPATTSWNRIKLTTAPSDPNIVYAFFETNQATTLGSVQQYNKSVNAWTVETVPTEAFGNDQCWYSIAAAVDPNNANILYAGSLDAEKSTNGGQTWTQYSSWDANTTASNYVHADHHAYVYTPGSSGKLMMGTDGGIFYTTTADGTPSFVNKNNGYDVTQFYSVALHPTSFNYALAGAQDNGSQKFSSAGIGPTTVATGGDGADVFIDQTNGNIQITSYVYDQYYLSTDNGVTFNGLKGYGNGQFINPTDYDPSTKSLYAGSTAGHYYRAENVLSPAYKQVAVSGFSSANVTAVAVSPITANRVYFGLDNGNVVLVDNAQTGTSLTGVVLKPNGAVAATVSCINIDPTTENHILVTYSNYGVTHIIETKNASAATPTWTDVSGNLPDMPVRWSLFYPGDPTKAIIATELGVWTTDLINGSATTWDPTNTGLANVEVDMLKYRAADQTIAAATHGRGIFTTSLNNDNLSNLTTSAGTLTPAFAAGTLNYTESVPNTTSQITVTPTAAATSSTITVNGTAVTTGTSSGQIALAVGSNTITVTVTAQNGVTNQSYIVTVTRAPSSNASLSALAVSVGTLTPVFATGTTSYTASVANSVTSLTLTPTSADATATLKVNGTAVTSGTASGAINLNVGSNIITTLVTAQDGTTTKSYTVTVTRAPSTNAYLSFMKIGGGGAVLSPAFTFKNTSYTASVPNTTTSVTVTPTTYVATSTQTVNGTALASGTTSAAIPLNAGSNTINIVVTAQDGVTTLTYNIIVTRAVSSNAGLSALKLNTGTLTPVFATGTTSYTASVANTVTSLTLTPTSADATATLKVNGTAVTSGTASGAINLNVGSNIITTLVTAQDGTTTKSYTVTVTRAPSTNAYLSFMKIGGGGAVLSPAFTFKNTSYTASVPNTTTSVTVTPTTYVATSTQTVNGTALASGTTSAAIPLNAGSNTINIVVTAQDGVTTLTYNIIVTRAVSSNAGLSALKLNTGTLTPVFATGTTSYTASVANTVTSLTLTPTSADATATLKVNGTAVTSGTASGAINLNVGSNIITTLVTAQDGTTTKTYTVTVTRGPSTNAYLSFMKIGGGGAVLSPAFTFKNTSYTASVPNTTVSATVTPTTYVTTSAQTVNGTALASGTTSPAIPLSVGSNAIDVVVTAQDGVTTLTYTITVTRAPGADNSLYQAVSVENPLTQPQLIDDGLLVHQALSPNGDGINDFLTIENISNYPDNKLLIMNRSGQLVFESKNYDNSTRVFDGHSNKTGQMQLPGTYFYALDYTVKGITKHKTGFLVLKY